VFFFFLNRLIFNLDGRGTLLQGYYAFPRLPGGEHEQIVLRRQTSNVQYPNSWGKFRLAAEKNDRGELRQVWGMMLNLKKRDVAPGKRIHAAKDLNESPADWQHRLFLCFYDISDAFGGYWAGTGWSSGSSSFAFPVEESVVRLQPINHYIL
jgi:hypothetical protein